MGTSKLVREVGLGSQREKGKKLLKGTFTQKAFG